MKKFYFYSLIIFIVIRSSLDYFTNFEVINLENYNLSINLASLLSFIFIVLCLPIFFNKERLKMVLKPPLIFFLLLLIWLGVTIFFAFDKVEGFREFVRLFTIFIAFAVSYIYFGSFEKFKYLIYAILVSSIIPALTGFFQFLSGEFYMPQIEDPELNFNRIQGTFAHPNPFGFYMFFVTSLFLICGKAAELFKNEKLKKLLLASLFISIILIILTFTRSVWFALFLFFLINFLIFNRKLIISLILISTFAYFFVPAIQDRLNDIFFDPFNSLFWRIILWQDMLIFALTKPFFGWGVGNFPVLGEYFRGLRFGSTEAHNDYFKIFFEGGFIGLILFLAWLFFILYLLIKNLKKIENQDLKLVSIISIILFSTILIISGFDNVLRVTAFQVAFWAYFGSLLALITNKSPKGFVITT